MMDFPSPLPPLPPDDPLQVAKSNGGANSANQVAYLWAKSLGESYSCWEGRWQTEETLPLPPSLGRRGECCETADQIWSAGGCSGLCHRQLVSQPLVITGCPSHLSPLLYRSFDFAFSIAKVALKSKVPEIHLKKALHLEDEVKELTYFSFSSFSHITPSLPPSLSPSLSPGPTVPRGWHENRT